MEQEVRALFSDGTKEYRNPAEPKPGDTVRLRFRALKGSVREVVLWIAGERIVMLPEQEAGCFVYFAAEYTVGDAPVTYFYEVTLAEDRHCYYDRRGAVYEHREEYAFRMTPGFTVPEWAKGAVMYQIFTDRFCNGTAKNDVKTNEY